MSDPFAAVLVQQELRALLHSGYLVLYILGHIADEALMVILAVSALSNRKPSEQGGRCIKQLSGVVMLGLGLVLLARPSWLLSLVPSRQWRLPWSGVSAVALGAQTPGPAI